MPTRDNSPERAAELEELRITCSTILAFLEERSYLPAPARFHAAVARAHEDGNLAGLRAALSDLNQRVRSLSQADREVMIERLRATGASTMDETARAIQAVVSRGAIDTEEEYRLILAYIDEIIDDPSKDDEVKRLNVLLGAHEDDSR